mmetsp:Transcript_22894/g.54317  ORF Transcript_22894/g.54317 Transcript_22894/m.54317 type:complete len:93 (+) Transcript_22894:658-936(+)
MVARMKVVTVATRKETGINKGEKSESWGLAMAKALITTMMNHRNAQNRVDTSVRVISKASYYVVSRAKEMIYIYSFIMLVRPLLLADTPSQL